MLLSSPVYLLFLGIVFLLYYMLQPGEPRRVLLLLASYFFYFELSRFYILVLFLVTIITYFGARWLRPVTPTSPRFFTLVLILVLVPLLAFKYLGPFVDLVSGFWFPHPLPRSFLTVVMPIGISFFTFTALGYLIDVYLEVVEPERSFSRVALFLAFFPLVSAGPIERAGRFIPQFELKNRFSAETASSGVQLILIGLILKIIFAQYLAEPSEYVLNSPTHWIPLENAIGMIDYTFYVYADFAGYSLIAIGSARMLGLQVQPNFQQPFLSPNMAEFWRRWHISLSSWVRDYMFVPLRTRWRRSPKVGMGAALLISITMIGVWHGAKWGYLVFGIMNAFLVLVATFASPQVDSFLKRRGIPPRFLAIPRAIITFFLFLLTLVVFRANSIGDAGVIYRDIFSFALFQNLFQAIDWFGLHHGPSMSLPGLNYRPWLIIAVLIIGDILARKKVALDKFPLPLQVAFYGLIIIEVVGGWLDTYVARPFVYNQF